MTGIAMHRTVGLALALLAWAAAAQEVQITKAPPKVERKTFDPADPPKPPPPLKHGEVAVCEYLFRIEVDLRFAAGPSSPAPGGGVRASIRVHQIQARLFCPITIWVPKNADAHVKAHEEGHRAIVETFYKDAEKILRPMATRSTGRAFEGVGPDRDAAYRAAYEKAARDLCEAYVAAIKGPTDRTEAIYDRITDFSRKRDLPSEKAVTEALAMYKEEAKAGTKK